MIACIYFISAKEGDSIYRYRRTAVGQIKLVLEFLEQSILIAHIWTLVLVARLTESQVSRKPVTRSSKTVSLWLLKVLEKRQENNIG